MSFDIVVAIDPFKPGRAVLPSFVDGDDQNFTLRFKDGPNFIDPTGVSVRLGYVAGLPDGTYDDAFAWVDRMANQHIGSFAISSGVPGSLTWDEDPIGVQGTNGAWLILGRTPPSSQIRKVNVLYGGSGLSSAPQIRFQGGVSETGQGATATATISANNVTAITVTNPGRGYSASNPPEVIITGDGTGSVWKVTDSTGISSGHIVQFTKVKDGSGYSAATVTIVDPEASATTSVGGSVAVSSLVLNAGGTRYTSAPSVSITGGGGSSATATAALLNSTWGLAGLTLTGGGSDFTSTPAVTFTGGTGSGATAVATVSPKDRILSVTITNGGTYTIGSYVAVSFSGGGGSGAAGNAVLGWIDPDNTGLGAEIKSVLITNAGSGYTGVPTVTFASASGSGAAGTAVLGTGAITSLTLTNPGSGYGATAPTVGFTGGGGSGATATAELVGSPVGSLTLTNGGSSYTSPPAVGFSGGNGSGASATAVVSLGITAVTMTKPGFAYTSQPTVNIVGTTTNGAILEAAGIETYSVPFLRAQGSVDVKRSVIAIPHSHGRRNSAGTEINDDSILIIRPRTLLEPDFTLQADGLTYAAVMNPVTDFVQAVLNFRRSVSVDLEIFGGGRLLYQGQLSILRKMP